MSNEAFEAVRDYAYTGRLPITDQNSGSICRAGKELNSEHILELAEKWLCKDIDELNILDRTLLAVDFELSKLREKCLEFYTRNPRVYHQHEQFLTIDVLSLRKLIVVFYHEDRVEENFDAVLKWIKHDQPNRKEFFSGLFCELPLTLHSKEYIFEVMLKEDLVKNDAQCLFKIVMLFKDVDYEEEDDEEDDEDVKTESKPFLFGANGSVPGKGFSFGSKK